MEGKPINSLLPAGVTDEQVKAWKAKYGEKALRVLKLQKHEGTTDTFDAVVRVPDRIIINEYQKYNDRNPQKASEILVKNCLLSGADEVMKDDFLFFTALTKLAELIPMGQAELVEL